MSCRRAAFTLTEAIAAVVVLAVAVPPMLWALQQAHANRASQVLATRAAWLAAERLEDLIADYHDAGFDAIEQAGYPAESPVPEFRGFSRTVAITHTNADLVSPGDTHARVAVQVSYADGRGVERTVELQTVLVDLMP